MQAAELSVEHSVREREREGRNKFELHTFLHLLLLSPHTVADYPATHEGHLSL